MKKLILLIPLIAGISQFTLAQKIGDNAEQVKLGAKLEVQSYYRAKGYHQVRMAYNVEYFNGKISDVILCKENVPMIDLRKPANFCTHYIMEKGKLTRILTQYSNISIQDLDEIMAKDFTKVDNYYFDTNDSDIYYKTFLSISGEATKALMSKSINPIPINVIKQLNKVNTNSLSNSLGDNPIALRKFTNLVMPQDDGQKTGKIAVQIKINKKGIVVDATPGVKGTTLNDKELWQKCKDAVMGASLTESETAPDIQTGVVVFNFKIK